MMSGAVLSVTYTDITAILTIGYKVVREILILCPFYR